MTRTGAAIASIRPLHRRKVPKCIVIQRGRGRRSAKKRTHPFSATTTTTTREKPRRWIFPALACAHVTRRRKMRQKARHCAKDNNNARQKTMATGERRRNVNACGSHCSTLTSSLVTIICRTLTLSLFLPRFSPVGRTASRDLDSHTLITIISGPDDGCSFSSASDQMKMR